MGIFFSSTDLAYEESHSFTPDRLTPKQPVSLGFIKENFHFHLEK